MGIRLPQPVAKVSNENTSTPEPTPNLNIDNIIQESNALPGPIGKADLVQPTLKTSDVVQGQTPYTSLERTEILKAAQLPETVKPSPNIDAVNDDERQMILTAALGNKRVTDPLYPARVRAREYQDAQIKNVNEISAKLKVSPEEAHTMLIQTPKDELKAMPALKDIDRQYPGITRWAQRPENFKVFLRNPEAVKKIEESNEGLSMVRDLGRVATQNFYNIQLAAIHSMMGTGTIDFDKGVNLLSKLQDEVEANQIKDYASQANRVGKSFDEMTKQFSESWGTLKSSMLQYHLGGVLSPSSELTHLKNTYKAVTGGTKGLGQFLSTALSEPEALTLMTLQSAYSAIPSIAALGLGTLAGGPGAGALAGGSAAGLVSFSQFYAEEQERYRNKTTGKVDFKAMYADPAVRDKMRIQAAKYAGAHALMEYVGGRVLTANVAGIAAKASKAPTILSKAAAITTGSVSAVSQEMAQEFAGETVAQVTIGTPLPEAVSQGVFEGIAGGLFGVGGLATQASVLTVRPQIKEILNVQKQLDKAVNSASKATEDANFITQSKAAMNESDLKDFKPQIQELINESTATVEVNSDGVEEIRDAYVTIDLNQLNDQAESMGRETLEIVSELGDNAREAYLKALTEGAKAFDLNYAEYHANSLNLPELDSIIYVNGNEYNASEASDFISAKERLQESIDKAIDLADSEIEFSADDGLTPPPIPGMDLESEIPPIPLDAQGAPADLMVTGENIDTVIRPVDLIRIGMSEPEQNIFNKMVADIKRVIKDSPAITDKTDISEASAKLLLDNMKMRAEVTGRDIKEIAKETAVFKKSATQTNSSYSTRINPEGDRSAFFTIATNATPATIIHEFGHSWLDNMAHDWAYVSNIDNRTTLQEEYFQAMETLADLFNIRDMGELINGNISKDEVRTIHESFAKTTERYFLEGESSSPKIKRALDFFRRQFAQFISSIMMRYPGIPSLEINAKTKRVFETILNASRNTDNQIYPLIAPPMFDPRVLGKGKEAESYLKAIAEARSEAIAELYGKYFNRSIKERESLIDATLDEFYRRAEADVDLYPSMQFKQGIQSGPAENRISFESLRFIVGDGDIEFTKMIIAQMANKIVAGQKKAGVDVRNYMAQMGINDKTEMLAFLLETGNRDGLIEDRARELINEEWPAFKTDSELHQEAVKAVNNLGRRKILSLELKILANRYLTTMQKMSGVVAKPAAAINAAAISEDSTESLRVKGQNLVRDSIAIKMTPTYFQQKQTREGRLASTELSKGNYEKAFEYKQEEAINYFAYKEAYRAKKAVDKALKQLRRYDKINIREVARTLDVDHIRYIQALSLSMREGSIMPFVNVNNFTYNSFDQAQVDTINTVIANLNESIQRAGTTANLTVGQIEMLGVVVKAVASQAANIMITLKNGEKVSIDATVNKIREEIGPRKKGDSTKSLDESFLPGLASENISMHNFMAGLFNSEKDYAQSTLSTMMADISGAEANRTNLKNVDMAKLEESARALAFNDPEIQSIWKGIKKRYNVMKSGISGKPIAAPELNYTFNNKGELIMFLTHLGSDSGRKVLFDGGLIDNNGKVFKVGAFNPNTSKMESASVDRMLSRMMNDGTITKEMMDFVQTIWDIYNTHYPEVKKSVRNVYKYDIGFVEAVPLQTPWGEYKGGYVPLNRKALKAEEGAQAVIKHFDVGGAEGGKVSDIYPFYTPTLAKERSGKVYPLDLDLTQLVYNLNTVYRTAYLMPVMYETAKVITHDDFKLAIEDRRPGYLTGFVYPWFNRVMSQRYTDKPESVAALQMTRVVSQLRINNRVKAFFGNLGSPIKQYLGLSMTGEIVGPRALTNAAIEVGLNAKAYRERISSTSERFKVLSQDVSTRTLTSLEEFTLDFDKLRDWNEMAKKYSFFMIQAAQNHVNIITYIAAENVARNKLKLTDAKAIDNYAMGVVERSQGTTALSGRPLALSGTELKRAMFDFLSPVLTGHGLIREATWRNASQDTKIKIAKLSATLATVAVIPAIGSFVVGEVLKGAFRSEDEDEDDFLKESLAAGAKETVDYLFPFYGGLAMSAFTDGPRGLARAVPVIDSSYRAVKSSQVIANEAELFFDSIVEGEAYEPAITSRQFRDLMDSITFGTGVPTSALSKIQRYYEDLIEEVD